MIFGIGTDLVCIDRIKRAIEKNERFPEKIFTAQEISYCSQKANPYQSYAGRFAAKEAVMKALGTGWNGKISWQDIEVVVDQYGKPILRVHNATKLFMTECNIKYSHLSISHDSNFACAFVVLERIDA